MYINEIKQWKVPSINSSNIMNYLETTHTLLLDRIHLYETLNEEYFQKNSFDDLYVLNKEYYKEINESYADSYANPAYCRSKLTKDFADIACVYYQEVIRSVELIFQGKSILFDHVLKKFLVLSNAIASNEDVYNVIENYQREILIDIHRANIEYLYSDKNFASTLLQNFDLSDLRYLFRYGICITETEIAFAKLVQGFDDKQIDELAAQMTYGYLKGFKRHNKDMKNRKLARIVMLVGLERIANRIQSILNKEGYKGFVGELVYHNSLSLATTDYNKINDIASNEEYYITDLDAYSNVLKENKELLYAYQGNIIMVAFGHKKREVDELVPYHLPLYEYKKVYDIKKRLLFESYVPKSEISYTGMAFPVKEIDEQNYTKIFHDVMEINKMPAEEHEKMQSYLIQILDHAEYIDLKGYNGNETDIRVYFHEIKDPDKETNFVNCGADVNIPVGEVYTTPRLKGTNGLIHLKRIRVAKIQFKDVRIKVEDGFTSEYSCGNTDDAEKNHQLMEDVIFHHKDKLPLGEFALGTNTFAYALGKKDGILHLFHTLIYEKLGPHIAIGDTCFAWAEDVPLYGEDGKLVIAKDNEFSIKRKENPTEAYVNQHYDLTIPYEEIGEITVHTRENTDIEIFRNGLFTLDKLAALNTYLK